MSNEQCCNDAIIDFCGICYSLTYIREPQVQVYSSFDGHSVVDSLRHSSKTEHFELAKGLSSFESL